MEPLESLEGCISFKDFDPKSGLVLFDVHAPCTLRGALHSIGLSKTAVSRLLAQGCLSVSYKGSGYAPTVRGDSLLGPSSAIAVVVKRQLRTDGAIRSGAVPNILYEDPFLVAVSKPHALLVHGDGTGAVTLTDEVELHLRGSVFPTVPQALQRLDTDTTGVVLFSKLCEFQSCFDALVAEGRMEKKYLAIVQGLFPQGITRIDVPLGRDRHDAKRMRVVERGGQQAITLVEPLAYSTQHDMSLLAVTLGTGRRHQIRVHLSSVGHPIVNDKLYGGRMVSQAPLMLHAYKERFLHPITGSLVVVEAGWPMRFSSWFSPVAV